MFAVAEEETAAAAAAAAAAPPHPNIRALQTQAPQQYPFHLPASPSARSCQGWGCRGLWPLRGLSCPQPLPSRGQGRFSSPRTRPGAGAFGGALAAALRGVGTPPPPDPLHY